MARMLIHVAVNRQASINENMSRTIIFLRARQVSTFSLCHVLRTRLATVGINPSIRQIDRPRPDEECFFLAVIFRSLCEFPDKYY
jgi:hypothetical protein